MKTILILTGMKSGKFGAMERYFMELCRLCRVKGYRTVLQYEAMPRSLNYIQQLNDAGIEIMIMSLNDNYRKSFFRIFRLISTIRPEILVTNFGKSAILGGFIARLLKVAKVITIGRCMFDLKKTSFIRRFAYNQYDHVVCISRAVADDLISGGVKAGIVSAHYLGIFGERHPSKDLRLGIRNSLGIPDDAIVLSCIAFDNKVKGLDILLESFHVLARKNLLLYLIVIGVNPSKSMLPQKAKELGVSDRIHWIGVVDEGWKFLNAADLYVQTSRNEGLCHAVVEAMALKLPVVVTGVGGMKELVISGKNGYQAEKANEKELSLTIERMLLERSKWKSFGQAGYELYQSRFRGEESSKMMVSKFFGLT